MIRALDLQPEDNRRYLEVRQHFCGRPRHRRQHVAYERKEPEEVFRCTICRNLGTIEPCMACRLKNGIPLPKEMQEGGGR